MVLVVVFGVLSVGLGACGSTTGGDQASPAAGAKASTAGQEEGAACIAALEAHQTNTKALCTEAANLGNADGMASLGSLADKAGDKASAKS